MTDIEILLAVRGDLAHLTRAVACQVVADAYGLTRSGVSGQLSRAERDPQKLLMLAEYLAHPGMPSPALAAAEQIVAESQARLACHPEPPYTAVFVSDLHVPVHDYGAISLLVDVLGDLPNVRYITAMNDALDFSKLSVFPERRSIRAQQVDDDILRSVSMYTAIAKSFKVAAPMSKLVAVNGNHDARAGMFGLQDGVAASNQLTVMRQLYEDAGVLFPALLTHQNAWSPAPGVWWTHGNYAMARLQTVAEKNYAYVKRTQGINHDITVVSGHVHRAGVFNMPAGGTSIISGCFHNRRPDYMRTLPDWDVAFVVTYVEADGAVFTDLVRFEGAGRDMFCRYNGRVYKAY